MNIVDAVLVAVLCVFAARGYAKGLFREVFALLGLAVGLVASFRYYQQISYWVDDWPFSPIILQVIVFTLLFFLIYIAFNWAGHMLHKSANLLFLGGFNRLGGLLLGGSKGALFIGVGLFLMISQSWVPQSFQQQFGKAALVDPFFGVGAWVAAQSATVRWPGTELESTPGDPRRGA